MYRHTHSNIHSTLNKKNTCNAYLLSPQTCAHTHTHTHRVTCMHIVLINTRTHSDTHHPHKHTYTNTQWHTCIHIVPTNTHTHSDTHAHHPRKLAHTHTHTYKQWHTCHPHKNIHTLTEACHLGCDSGLVTKIYQVSYIRVALGWKLKQDLLHERFLPGSFGVGPGEHAIM